MWKIDLKNDVESDIGIVINPDLKWKGYHGYKMLK